jgi:ATP-dependent DNA ligase
LRFCGEIESRDALVAPENSLNIKFPYIVEPLNDLTEGTVVDGELVALDDSGGPSFHALQNFRFAASRIHFYIFDCYVVGTAI